jgi:ubiquinone/menaquinone biosynthesis C-methylase UbiE
MTLLDAGCGSGIKTDYFRRNHSQVTAIDLSSISASHSYGTVMSVLDLRFKDQSFNIVHSAGVLHHTPNPRKGFSECCRVLKRRGTLIVALYNKDNIIYPICYKLFSKLPRWIVFPIYLLGWRLVGSKKKKEAIWRLMMDQFYTPIAHFYSPKEIGRWFKEEGIQLNATSGAGYFKFLPDKKRAMIYYCGMKV